MTIDNSVYEKAINLQIEAIEAWAKFQEEFEDDPNKLLNEDYQKGLERVQKLGSIFLHHICTKFPDPACQFLHKDIDEAIEFAKIFGRKFDKNDLRTSVAMTPEELKEYHSDVIHRRSNVKYLEIVFPAVLLRQISANDKFPFQYASYIVVHGEKIYPFQMIMKKIKYALGYSQAPNRVMGS